MAKKFRRKKSRKVHISPEIDKHVAELEKAKITGLGKKSGQNVKIVVANQKGGVGKTDLCVNLSACLANKGKKVLLIDLDPQANSTIYLTNSEIGRTTYDLLTDENVELSDTIHETIVENLHLVPSNINLSAAHAVLSNDPGMQFRLKKKLDKKGDGYDYIIIDTPPSLGVLSVNALTAANEVIIPVQTHFLSLDGVAKLIETLNSVKEHTNPELDLGGIILTMYDKRNNLSKEIEGKVRKAFKDKVFRSVIPINVRLAESPSHHKPIMLYAPSSRGASAYKKLANEFTKRIR